jgi:non-heme chloroperoxidase
VNVELVKHGALKVHAGAPHGIYGAYQEELDRDILEVIKG